MEVMALMLQTAADMTSVSSSLSRLSLLLSLLLLVPRVGLAAQETSTSASEGSATEGELLPESSRIPGTDERAPLRLNEDSWAREPQRPSRDLRILAEAGAGLLAAAGGGVAGYLGGAMMCSAGMVGSQGGWFPCLGPAAVGLVAGAGLGGALGVFWGGEAAGGEGRLLGALAGMGSGVLASFLVGVVSGQPNIGFVLSLPLALVGSIVGYELTDHGAVSEPRAPSSPAVASARPRLQPVLTVSSRGALMGLGGTF
jgi:hypothetical protein